jgi:tRNA threonylcarbamoyl adenosine modification protein YjeE
VLTLHSAAQMIACGRAIAAVAEPGDVVILDGPLGAGKTTFTRGFGEGLNVRGPITSPTFVIARVHPSLAEGPALVHVDAYRIDSLEDIDSLDLDESLEDSVTVVEWGLGRVEHLADTYLVVSLGRSESVQEGEDGNLAGDDDVRTLEWRAVGDGWNGRIPRLSQFLGEPRN